MSCNPLSRAHYGIILSVLVPFLVSLLVPAGAGVAAASDSLAPSPCFPGADAPPVQPQLFAPGVVNQGLITRDVAMTPDGREIYFCQVLPGYAHAVICVTTWRGGAWSEPEVAPFSGSTGWVDLEPAISPDGKRFFFYSTRPHPDGGDAPQDLWVMDRTGDGWSEPRPVGAPVNTAAPEFFPSVDRAGNLYFCRADPQTRVHTLWVAAPSGDRYAEPVLLPDLLNAGRNRFNAQVTPAGDRIVIPVAGHPDNHGGVDYWMGLRGADGAWERLVNLGLVVNDGSGQAWSPAFSPDGSAFFFMSGRIAGDEPAWPQTWSLLQARHRSPGQGRPGIWWMDAAFLDKLAAGDASAPAGGPAEPVALAAAPTFPRLTGPCLGQALPGPEPEIFAAGVVSTGLTERDIAFAPDGSRVLFGVMDLGLVTLMESELVDGVWSEPVTAGFHDDPDFACFEPTFSDDGRTVIFLTNRAAPGQEQGRGWANQNLFSSHLRDGRWSAPQALPAPVTTEAAEYFPSLAADGTLYFTREDAEGHGRLWSAEPLEGGYAEPVRLPDHVNLGTATYNTFVARDESFLITCVAGHEQNLGPADYWISFRSGAGQWEPAVHLDERFNGEDVRAISASLSPDGRALFFSTTRMSADLATLPERWTRSEFLRRHELPGAGGMDVWWIDADVLEDFR